MSCKARIILEDVILVGMYLFQSHRISVSNADIEGKNLFRLENLHFGQKRRGRFCLPEVGGGRRYNPNVK